ncbi:MAG: response regulator [Actinomycetia bacterium]|nr:response regulator [Actinomycetes bacterium]
MREEAPAAPPAAATPAAAGAARILVVDDDPINLQVLRNYLAAEDFDPTLASSGEQALRLLGEETFDLVLLDVMMPRLSGYEVCRALREKHPIGELPVLFLTAKTQDSDVVTGMALGANDYLTKPISRDRLLARVRPHLDLLHIHRNLEDLVQEKMSEVKVLAGLLPICCKCKKIRDDEGYWGQLEVFIHQHSEAEFSHGICPECLEPVYAERPELRPREPS